MHRYLSVRMMRVLRKTFALVYTGQSSGVDNNIWRKLLNLSRQPRWIVKLKNT
jgi:hypothetical protein